jgi:hypothetical protein
MEHLRITSLRTEIQTQDPHPKNGAKSLLHIVPYERPYETAGRITILSKVILGFHMEHGDI